MMEKQRKRKDKKRDLIIENLKYIYSINFVCKIIFIIFLSGLLRLEILWKKKKKLLKIKNSENIITNQIYKNINESSDYFACFCAKARGENKYARELIPYYSKLGVEKFIFGDNNYNGTEKLTDVLQDYVDSGLIDIYEIFGSDIRQADFYQFIYEKYKNKCKWFLYLEFDEYLYVHFENNKSLILQDFLTNKTFDKCEAVLFNWLIYTDNDLLYYDNRTLLERFTSPKYDSKANTYVKSIVRGGLNKTIFYPKKSSHVPDSKVIICDSKGRILTKYNVFGVSPPVFDYGVLKHFTTKTAEEYVNKTKRGVNGNVVLKPEDRIMVFFSHNKFTEEKLKIFEKGFNKSFSSIKSRLRIYNH